MSSGERTGRHGHELREPWRDRHAWVPVMTGPGGDFVERLLLLAPGESHPYVETEWLDAIVLVALGRVEVEVRRGIRQPYTRGDVFWLAGLPVLAVHNIGPGQAALVRIARRARSPGAA
jgi:hypothetical protein